MKCFDVGRFVADPVLRDVNETKVCAFSLAINEYRRVNGERKKFAHFFEFEVWDKAAELIAQYCKKGDLLQFLATARQQKWNDKESGEPRSKVVFRIDDFNFLPRGNTVKEESDKSEEAPAF